MDIANLIIRVTNEGLDRATRELRRLQENAQGAQAANKKFGESIADLNKLAMVGFGALTGVVALSTKRAIEFESVMGSVAKVVDETANTSIKDISDGLKELSKTTPLSVDALGDIAAAGGSLGVVADDIIGFTDTVSKMAVAFDMSADMAGDAIANLSTVLGKPIDEMKAYGDMINQIADTSSAKASEIVSGMLDVGGAFKAFGVADDYALALTSTLITMGKSGSEAGTVFKRVLNIFGTLDVASKSTIGSFDKLGIDIDKFSSLMKTDATAAIEEYSAALLAVPSGERIGLAAQTFGGAYANDIVAALTNTEKFNDILGEIELNADGVSKALGSLEREYETVSATTANKLQLVKNNIDLVAISIGDAFLPALNDLILAVVPVIERLGEWSAENPELIRQIVLVAGALTGSIIAIATISGAIGTAIGAFQGIAAIVGVAITVFKALLSPIILIQSAIAHLWPVFVALTSPIGLVVLAIAALIAIGVVLYKNWDTIKAKATEVWGSVTSYIGGKITEIKSYFSTNFPAMTAIVSGSIEIIKTLFVGGFNLIKNTVTTVLGVIKAVITGDFKAIPGIIGNGLKTAAGIVGSMMANILNIIKEAGKKLFNIGRDFIQGFINGIKSVGSSVVSAASGMVGNAIAAVKRKQDSASPSKVTTKLGGDFSQGMANGIKKGAKAVKSEAQKMAEQAIETVKNSIASLQKEIALFGNDSPLASFNFDVSVGKFAGVPDSLLDKNRELITQKMRLIDLDKQQVESEKALATARESIQERFDKLKADKASSSDALQGMLSGIEEETPLGKIQADYEERLAVIETYEQMHTDMLGVQAEARLAVEQSYMDAKRDLMLTQGEALFGDLAGLAKGFAGEQSGIYKALFLVEKGFAIAQSAIAIQASIAKAMAVGFPANIPIIGQAVSQGMGIMSSIKGITAGFKAGGYTGNLGASQVAGVVHGQEYVFDAQATKRIGVDNLNAMRRGDKVGGGDVNITVNNMSSARVETQKDDNGNIIMTIREEVKKSWGSLSNPNSFESKQVNRNVQAPRRR